MANKTKTTRSDKGIEWNRVTWYSRIWALFVFLLIIPVISFYIGTQYERTTELLSHATWQQPLMAMPHQMRSLNGQINTH